MGGLRILVIGRTFPIYNYTNPTAKYYYHVQGQRGNGRFHRYWKHAETEFEKTDFKDLFEKLTFIADSIDMELRTDSDIDRDYDFEKITSRLNSMYGVIAPIKMKMENMKKSIQEKEYFLENISFLEQRRHRYFRD